jgi:hypothetical protein
MNQSKRRLELQGIVTDGGAPRCRACQQLLRFDADRTGRTTESCACGYRGYVQVRSSDRIVALSPPPMGSPLAG